MNIKTKVEKIMSYFSNQEVLDDNLKRIPVSYTYSEIKRVIKLALSHKKDK